MSSDPAELVVMLDAAELGPIRPTGVVRRRPGRRAVITYEYARSWLEWSEAFPIDPALPLASGESFFGDGVLPGILGDTAPDRWGRRLLERQEASLAVQEARPVRLLDDWDLLIRVADETRMGALRLGTTASGPFLDQRGGVPPYARLRDLEFAAAEIERGPRSGPMDPAILLLIAPGSSLGGARPKANYVAADGTLWIAKFPSREDRRDVGRWEYLLITLARSAGITVPDCRALTLSPVGTTVATRRFDRTGPDRRLYASAMTLTGKRDGAEASYLDLALAVADHVDPAAIGDDLEQLFRRLAFNILVGNRDDHLRNHGFLRAVSGWRLAPAFDLNPSPESPEHSLAIDERSHGPDVATAIETASFYRLGTDKAARIVREVAAAIGDWREAARSLDLPADEVELMATVIG